MPYEVTWMVDQRVIYFHPSGVVNVDEVREANEQIRTMTEQGIQFVHVVADATNLDKITFGLSELAKLFRGMKPSPKLGWSVYVSSKMVERFFASVTTQMTTARHREFTTLAEAIAFLQTMDDTLPTLPTPKPVEDKS